MVLNAVRKAKQSDHKEVVVVTGGPGTGKSVIALSLLGELYRQGIPALHATGSQSFTKTMRKVAGRPEARGAGPLQVLQQLHDRRRRTASTS